MRTIDAPTLATIEAGAIAERDMILFDFPSGFHGFWTGDGVFTWNGLTFNGTGSLLSVASIEERDDLGSVALEVRLRALPEAGLTGDVLAEIESEAYHQRPVTIYKAFFHPLTAALLSVSVRYRGTLDQIEHDEAADGEYTLIGRIECRSRDHTRTGYRLRSDADQRLIDPDDGGLRYAIGASRQQVYWGAERPKKIE
ncbi:hypothetical protein FHS85_001746 [Rhodoligotrophos appendicifer]|uniref:hypothetical protein n=1 Tax=Rhodoligotrophos appendicifer TaxID=987056 RepID=UPI0011850F39|nr:hypothetical protein [Rhodoligotrophos appendicifer]